MTTILNRCICCEELGVGHMHPWRDEPWGVRRLCAMCALRMQSMDRIEFSYRKAVVLAKCPGWSRG